MNTDERPTVVDGARVLDDEALLTYYLLVELVGRDLADLLTNRAAGHRIPSRHRVNRARRRRAFTSGQMEMFASAPSGRDAARLAGVPYSTWRRWNKPLAAEAPRKATPRPPVGASKRSWKICTKCGLRKPPARFYRDRRSPDGRTARCRWCVYTPRPREQQPSPKNHSLYTGAAERGSLLA